MWFWCIYNRKNAIYVRFTAGFRYINLSNHIVAAFFVFSTTTLMLFGELFRKVVGFLYLSPDKESTVFYCMFWRIWSTGEFKTTGMGTKIDTASAVRLRYIGSLFDRANVVAENYLKFNFFSLKIHCWLSSKATLPRWGFSQVATLLRKTGIAYTVFPFFYI